MSIRITRDSLTDGINDFDNDAINSIGLVVEYWATRAMSMMRTGARWTDRTGNARQGLRAKRFNEGDAVSLVLWHSVPYGIWLEVRWSGEYAIVGPTLNNIAPKVLKMAGEAVMRSRRVG